MPARTPAPDERRLCRRERRCATSRARQDQSRRAWATWCRTCTGMSSRAGATTAISRPRSGPPRRARCLQPGPAPASRAPAAGDRRRLKLRRSSHHEQLTDPIVPNSPTPTSARPGWRNCRWPTRPRRSRRLLRQLNLLNLQRIAVGGAPRRPRTAAQAGPADQKEIVRRFVGRALPLAATRTRCLRGHPGALAGAPGRLSSLPAGDAGRECRQRCRVADRTRARHARRQPDRQLPRRLPADSRSTGGTLHELFGTAERLGITRAGSGRRAACRARSPSALRAAYAEVPAAPHGQPLRTAAASSELGRRAGRAAGR